MIKDNNGDGRVLWAKAARALEAVERIWASESEKKPRFWASSWLLPTINIVNLRNNYHNEG